MPIPDFSEKTISDLISLHGRRAIITGAARGIGLAISSRLAEAGASVYLADFDAILAETSARDLTEKGYHAMSGYVDVAESASVSALVDHAVQQLGGIDIWVNNAGIYPTSPVLEISDAAWARVLGVNLTGTFVAARAAAMHMVQAGKGGVIINLASVAGYQGSPGITHYVASKHGIRGLTKNLAIELGPHNIRVLALAPTFIITPGTTSSSSPQEAAIQDGIMQFFAAKSLLGRNGLPDDVARVALFAASDLSAFMTGSTILIDAGSLASGSM
jgi:NAD(P)-dependent dehydrogenase (short-subunit alcohol dehydrogenase family)